MNTENRISRPLEALDVDLLNKNLLQLFAGEETEFPIFDFKKGGRLDKGRILQIERKKHPRYGRYPWP